MKYGILYPETPRVDAEEVIHGKRIVDPYRWLEDVTSPQTRDWMRDQTQLTRGWIKGRGVRSSIRQRLTRLRNCEQYSVPIGRGHRRFFTCREGKQEHPVLYYISSGRTTPKALVNPNELSPNATIALTGYSVSNDGSLVAYGLSEGGSDWQTWRVRRVDDGQDLQEQLEWIKAFRPGIAWDPKSEGFFYSKFDQPEKHLERKALNRNQAIYYHTLGTQQNEDELVYQPDDLPERYCEGSITEDGRYLIIVVVDGCRTENGILYLDLTASSSRVVELFGDFDARYDVIGTVDSTFYVLTDRQAGRRKLVAVNVDNPRPRKWAVVVPEGEDVLEDARLIGDRFLLHYLHSSSSALKIFSLQGHLETEVGLPSSGTVKCVTHEHSSSTAYYIFSSFFSPATVYRCDVTTGHSTPLHESRLRLDPSDFVSRRVTYESRDGTEVDLFIAHRRGIVPNGENPTYLYAYGGYSVPLTPSYSAFNMAWMDMGGVYAQACVRGGGEYGTPWHEAGKLQNKQRTLEDAIAAAEWLIDHNYTNSEQLAIGGWSNGGLVAAACLTRRPDLFGACAPTAGTMDMLRFHKFTVGWGWVPEFGSPDNPEEFSNLLSYSPYHNLKPGAKYPATLIITGDHDDRVFPAHSLKFAAALQAAQGGEAPILLRVTPQTGHEFGTAHSAMIDEESDILAFFAQALNLEISGTGNAPKQFRSGRGSIGCASTP